MTDEQFQQLIFLLTGIRQVLEEINNKMPDPVTQIIEVTAATPPDFIEVLKGAMKKGTGV